MVFARSVLGIGIGALLLLATLASSAHAADNYFLKLEGIEGESTDRSHARWIELVTVGWGTGVASGVATKCAPGRECRGYSGAEEMTITKHPDRTSPQILAAMQGNRLIPTATLHLVHEGAVVGIYTLQNVLITTISRTGADERITLRFQRIEWSHAPGKSLKPR